MIATVFIFIFGVSILLLPLVFWMYVITNLSSGDISRRHFVVGVGVGGISLISLGLYDLYFLGDIISRIFQALGNFSGGGSLQFSFWLSVLAGILLTVYIILSYILGKRFSGVFLGKIVGSSLFLTWFTLFICLISGFYLVYSVAGVQVYFQQYVYQFLGLIIAYYFVVSLLEEFGKYYGSALLFPKRENISFQSVVLIAASVALGFSFFENIHYAYSYIVYQGINTGILQLIFFRSLFTIVLHIFSAMLMSAGFWYILYKKASFSKKNFFTFFLFTFLSLLSHAFFDVSLTYNLIGIIFLYIVFLYIFITLHLEKQESEIA